MKEIVITGALALAAYYAYQKWKNPNATPASVANDLINQASNFIAQQTEQPVTIGTSNIGNQLPAASPKTILPAVTSQPVVSTPVTKTETITTTAAPIVKTIVAPTS